MTVFGKNGLNEICVEPFFSATHFETLKCIKKTFSMHSETFATFPNGNWKRSITLKNHFKTFRKRLQTLISASLFSALGYIPRVLSRVEFGRVLVQLTRITRALFQNIKILRKFPYFYSLFPFSGCSLLCWAIYGPVRLSLYTHKT